MRRSLLKALSTAALIFSLTVVIPLRLSTADRTTDYAAFYAAGRLASEGNLYDAERLQQIELETTGAYSPDHGFVRLPFYAALHRPLSLLDFPVARLIWNAASMAALAGFVLLWPVPRPPESAFWACLSIPAFITLANGQDINFALLFLAAGMRLFSREEHFLAGVVWSLCAIKFHLFFAAPILAMGARRSSALAGLAAGGAVLAGVSFAVAGPNWLAEWFAAATAESFSPNLDMMPNLRGLTAALPYAVEIEALLSAVALLSVFYIARRLEFSYALAAALIAGLLASHHAYLPDMALLLPAGLTIIERSTRLWMRILAGLLMTPIAHFSALVGPPASAAPIGCMILLLAGAVAEARRAPPEAVESFGGPRADPSG